MSRISRPFQKVASVLCGLVVVFGSFAIITPVAHAQSTDANAALIAELQAMIAQLVAQLAALTGQQSSDQKYQSAPADSSHPLTLTAPNNGEKWQIGDTHTILWTPYDMSNDQALVNPAADMTAYLEKVTGRGNVNVGKLVYCGKASIHTDLALEECGTGKYAEPGQYYIRLVNNKTGESDRIDRPVTLVARGTLKADIQINGSDVAIAVPAKGATYKASWTSNAEQCRLSGWFSKSEYSSIENLPASGSKTIKVFPNPEGYEDAVYIGCTSSNGIEGSANDYVAVKGGAVVVENPVNEKGTITVTYPNGGEIIGYSPEATKDVPMRIRWNWSVGLSKVSIALYKKDATYKWIVKDLPVNEKAGGEYPVDASFFTSIPYGDDYKIYMIGYKVGGGTVEDKSDRPFSIRSTQVSGDPSITSFQIIGRSVEKGSMDLPFGDPMTISWSTSGPARVALDFICQDDQNVQFIRKSDRQTLGCAKGGIWSYSNDSKGSITLTPVHSKEMKTSNVTFQISLLGEKVPVYASASIGVRLGVPEKAPSTSNSTSTPSGLDVPKGTETQSHAKAIFADWQKNESSYTEVTPMPLSTGSPVHTLLRLVRNCSDSSVVSKSAIRIQDGGYSNYTGSSRYQEQCIDDGSFDQYYDEAKVDGGSGEVSVAPATSQMAGALEALKAALGALSAKLR